MLPIVTLIAPAKDDRSLLVEVAPVPLVPIALPFIEPRPIVLWCVYER